ncbi:MAG: argonaute PAZ domain-containing protein [Thermosynechococcus sp. Uc]|uniref:argonaute PAZ domain-containing protein n=1 Tax=Thermosynechococcus sp. Uc TaxID=3034853 RepID=UPI00259EE328|nr:argonaute PAZ domain-containing protein [Thermosynechococcus sp. Uc]MDM7327021.1 argonaute PAZ domain-containing protein [Thermosynechococcus sp. Uc]
MRLRKVLESSARNSKNYDVQKGTDNSILLLKKSDPEIQREGWQVFKGLCCDVRVDAAANLYLEVDCQYHFHTPWNFQQWLEKYPHLPFSWLSNTYRTKDNQLLRWEYVRLDPEASPDSIFVAGCNKTLAEYHRDQGAKEDEITKSQVVYVRRRNSRNDKEVPHLSCRLTPSVTLEILSELRTTGDTKLQRAVDEVFQKIRIPVKDRLEAVQGVVEYLCKEHYKVAPPQGPVQKTGYQLPSAVFLAKDGQIVKGVNEIFKKGCAQVGEETFGFLNLDPTQPDCPPLIKECLDKLGKIHGKTLQLIPLQLPSPCQGLPTSELERQQLWRDWAEGGSGSDIRTALVMMPYSLEKQRIREEALGAGIATQFFTPENMNNSKVWNIILGLLCKAKWQPVYLQLRQDLAVAELIIGFDAGTDRSLFFGTSAFAILANGQSLGWELPIAQRGEKISGEAIKQIVLKLVGKFQKHKKCDPKKVLLLRDGLVWKEEFESTIQALEKKNIQVDILSVRKTGAGRVAQGNNYAAAPKGTVIFEPEERSFILVSSEPIKRKTDKLELGSARPLQVIHEYGDTPLDLLAVQTYHLAQLHPASAFSHARLPWVLHLAHLHSQEFARIKNFSLLDSIDRNKLIAV